MGMALKTVRRIRKPTPYKSEAKPCRIHIGFSVNHLCMYLYVFVLVSSDISSGVSSVFPCLPRRATLRTSTGSRSSTFTNKNDSYIATFYATDALSRRVFNNHRAFLSYIKLTDLIRFISKTSYIRGLCSFAFGAFILYHVTLGCRVGARGHYSTGCL